MNDSIKYLCKSEAFSKRNENRKLKTSVEEAENILNETKPSHEETVFICKYLQSAMENVY